MNKQNMKTWFIPIVVGVTAAGTAVILSTCHNKHSAKYQANKNRKLVEKFIASHTGNNTKLLEVVEKLSDQQILSLVNMIDRLKQMQNKVYVDGNNIKELTQNIIKKVSAQI